MPLIKIQEIYRLNMKMQKPSTSLIYCLIKKLRSLHFHHSLYLYRKWNTHSQRGKWPIYISSYKFHNRKLNKWIFTCHYSWSCHSINPKKNFQNQQDTSKRYQQGHNVDKRIYSKEKWRRSKLPVLLKVQPLLDHQAVKQTFI